MSDTPRMDTMLETALRFLSATPHNGDITEQHIVAIGVILSQLGGLGKTLERELAAAIKERDEAKARCSEINELKIRAENIASEYAKECDELKAMLESEKCTRNHIIAKGVEMQRELDESRADCCGCSCC